MLLEALWCYYVNQVLYSLPAGESCELAWMAENQYNDYACIARNGEWNPNTREGEFFRIEAKSMNLDADESKGHFDELQMHLGLYDLLLVMVWQWETTDAGHYSPIIKDHFIGPAKAIATLRDELHILRGGTILRPGQLSREMYSCCLPTPWGTFECCRKEGENRRTTVPKTLYQCFLRCEFRWTD